jgi:hypothetical protein
VIDLGRAIKYPFSGPNAVAKSIIGGLMALLLPLFFLSGIVLLGYQQRIIRDVLDGRDDELPEWDSLGGTFGRGLVVFAGTLLYYLPAFILVGLAASLALDVLSGFNLYDIVIAQTSTPTLDRDKLSMIVLCFALALIWLLLSAPLVMAAIARYAETGEFSAFVNILSCADEVWAQRKAAGLLMFNLFLLALLTQVASLVASSTCVLGAYIQFVNFAAISHLNGQWGAHLRDHRPHPSVIRPIQPPARR